MKYLLIPMNGGSNSSDKATALLPGMILNFISALALALYITQHIPGLHGWPRFGICTLLIIGFIVLSFVPYISLFLCLLSAIFWSACVLSWTGGIAITGLKWILRIIGISLIFLSESVIVLS